MSRIPDNVRAYTPTNDTHPWANKKAMTFQGEVLGLKGEEKRRICYLDKTDHHTCLLPGQEEVVLAAQQLEKGGQEWAVRAEMVRSIPLLAIAGGYGFHLLGIDLPLIGGGMTAAKWGIAAGLALELGGIVPAAALAHTLITGGRFLGPQGLFTRGVAMYGVGLACLYSTSWRSRGFLQQGWVERQKLDQHYTQLWNSIAKDLREDLEKEILGETHNLDALKQDAKELLELEEKLKEIYGLNIDHYRASLKGLCERIKAYKPTAIQPDVQQGIHSIYPRIGRHQLQQDPIPCDLRQRKYILEHVEILKMEANPPASANKADAAKTPDELAQWTAYTRQLEDARTALFTVKQDVAALDKASRELDALSQSLSQKSVELIKSYEPSSAETPLDANAGNDYLQRAKDAETQADAARAFTMQKDVTHPLYAAGSLEEINAVSGTLQVQRKKYAGLEAVPAHVERAIVIATLLKNRENDSMEIVEDGKKRTVRRWEGVKEKLALLEAGMLDCREFVTWVEVRAVPEERDHSKEVYVEAHRVWDAYCYLNKDKHSDGGKEVKPIPFPR